MLPVLLLSSKEPKIVACLLLLLIQPPPHIKSEVPQPQAPSLLQPKGRLKVKSSTYLAL